MSLARTILSLVVVSGMSACYDVTEYRGDGSLENRGRFEAKSRYVLSLGAIDIGKFARHEFDIVGLPSEEFVVGLEIELPKVGPEESPREYLPCNPLVFIQIVDSTRDEAVLEFGGRIANEWAWSIATGDPTAFVYMRKNGGKHFRPESPQHRYTLTVRVASATEESCVFRATLMAKSPGWK